jgi:hypothetical protein
MKRANNRYLTPARPRTISSTRSPSWLFLCAVAVILAGSSTLVMRAAPPTPDPCKLITQAELEQIAGPLKGSPKPGDIASGDVSCEYKPVKTPSWISIRLHDGELSYWKSRNGGPNPVSLPEFGKDAFVNADSEGSTDLYAKKGNLILRISMPKGPSAVEMAKAIAKKALPRL